MGYLPEIKIILSYYVFITVFDYETLVMKLPVPFLPVHPPPPPLPPQSHTFFIIQFLMFSLVVDSEVDLKKLIGLSSTHTSYYKLIHYQLSGNVIIC